MSTRSILLNICVWAALALSEVSFFSAWRIGVALPNIVVAALACAIVFNTREVFVWHGAIAAGVILDIYSPDRFGLMTVLVLIILTLNILAKNRMSNTTTWLFILIFSAGGSFIYDEILAVVSRSIFNQVQWYIVFDSVYTFIIAGIMYLIIQAVQQKPYTRAHIG